MTKRIISIPGHWDYDFVPCTDPFLGDGFEIEIDGTQLTYKTLLEISTHFGTNDIDIDHYSRKADCETCGHGERKCYKLQIYNATKNNPLS